MAVCIHISLVYIKNAFKNVLKLA